MEHRLHEHPLFTTQSILLSEDERIKLSYRRAMAIVRAWGEPYNAASW